jgi:hypothetical protein
MESSDQRLRFASKMTENAGLKGPKTVFWGGFGLARRQKSVKKARFLARYMQFFF